MKSVTHEAEKCNCLLAFDENNKDTIIASLKRKMKKLEEENKKLREQLKFSYADVYQRIRGNDC
ncbi:hypothetical protein BSK55_10800 [Paenibacillus odorifer]|nr:hypothetical protein BSK55_10800 [Paenibacillus odorifer]